MATGTRTKTGRTDADIAAQVENLYVDSVDSKPQDRDWSEGWPDSWDFYECVSCGGSYDDETIPDHDTDAYGFCQLEGCPHYGEPDESGSREGPMMSYLYPVDVMPEDAEKIADLPLCVVICEDGTSGLALTGGGMDLSWEICEAFIRLGHLPPAHFCGLPRMGKRSTEENRLIVAACRRSLECQRNWSESKLASLDRAISEDDDR